MKKVLFFLFVCFVLNYTIIADSDNTEIFMHTRDTGDEKVEFLVYVNTDKPIWNPSTYRIDTENWQNPASLEIEGDDISTNYGWHTDEAQRVYDGNPCLQWTYEYKIRVSGKTTFLKVETLGWAGWDEDIMYDYNDDEYYIWNRSTGQTVGDPITTILNMRDNTSYLQPTAPQNFSCTNPSQNGHNPHFEWESPEHPSLTTFSYNMYRDTGSGYVKINDAPITDCSHTDTGIIINKFGSNTVYYYVKAKGSHSLCPLSNKSDVAPVNTNIEKKMSPENEIIVGSEDS